MVDHPWHQRRGGSLLIEYGQNKGQFYDYLNKFYPKEGTWSNSKAIIRKEVAGTHLARGEMLGILCCTRTWSEMDAL